MKNVLYTVFNFFHRLLQRALNCASMGVKGLIVNGQGQVMLIEHTYMEGWHLPGGRVDPGETPKQAIMRELLEECGIRVKADDLELFAIYSHRIYTASDYPILYVATVFEQQTKHPCAEIKQAQWFDLDQLPSNTTEKTLTRIAEYRKLQPVDENW